MTAGTENEQKAKDTFKLSLYIGKEALISTNNNNKKRFSKTSQQLLSLESKKKRFQSLKVTLKLESLISSRKKKSLIIQHHLPLLNLKTQDISI